MFAANAGTAQFKFFAWELQQEIQRKSLRTIKAPRVSAERFVSVAAGRLAATSSDFAALVGHPPKSLDCLIHEYFAPRSPA